MKVFGCVLASALCLCATPIRAQTASRTPQIGYIFPAGGQRGTAFEALVGGQFLGDVNKVYCAAEGVRVEIVKHYRPPRTIDRDQRLAILRRLVECRKERIAELPPRTVVPPLPGERLLRKALSDKNEHGEDMNPVELPDHPIFRNMERKSLRELQWIADEFLDPKTSQKRQLNTQLAEIVLLKIEIASETKLGFYEFRLGTKRGMTNPLAFEIGGVPEVLELEPNGPIKVAYLPPEPPLDLPVVLNGRIMPGDADRFQFKAHRGQKLVIKTHARRLIPFLADAVPGWFQPVTAVYDAAGREVAYADDYRFDPDPVLLFAPPEDGVYELEIKDSIYRGREDFVYRIHIGESPFITHVFPLGGCAGKTTVATIEGWNLPTNRISLDTGFAGGAIRSFVVNGKDSTSNEIFYAVDSLQEVVETEANDEARRTRLVSLPCVINGRIERAGKANVHRFRGRAGDEVVAEVLARRLRSPLDSLLHLTDEEGRVVAWNDDAMERAAGFLHCDMGVLTHHADSYLRATLPADGTYGVRIADARDHGGEEYGYRLRLGPPRPSCEVLVAPSGLKMTAGRATPLTAYAVRKDGFDGAIEISLRDAPDGFALAGGRIPVGRDCVRMTLTAPLKTPERPFALQLWSRIVVDGKTVEKPAVPCEEMMQAFLYRHLVPSRELLIDADKGGAPFALAAMTAADPVRIPVGGEAHVEFKGAWRQPARKIEFILSDPPKGIALGQAELLSNRLTLTIKTVGEELKAGFADNLLIEAFTTRTANPDDADKAAPQRVALGFLPAVPILIVQP